MNAEKFNVPSAEAALLQWSVFGADGNVEISLAGEFDLAAAEPFAEMIQDVLEKAPTEIVVEMADVSFLDSTGIRCLVGALRRAAEIECNLVVRDPSRRVSRVLQICGVEELLVQGAEGVPARDR
jgi:anti-anti-sigma factor